MKKNVSKLLCLLLAVLAVFCLQTAVFAEEEVPVADNQILGPMGASDEEGNLLISTDDAEMLLKTDFGANSLDALAWNVISGKDVLSVHAREGYPGQAIAVPLADGEAVVIAYLEDGSQVSATKKIIVSNQKVDEVRNVTLTTSVEGSGNIERKTGADTSVMLGESYSKQFAPGTVMDLTAVETTTQPFKYWVVRHNANATTKDKDIIVSTEKNYKFTLGQNMTIAAVFDKTDDGTLFGINATFKFDNIVASNIYVNSMTENAPEAPYQRNKIFDKWTSEQEDAATAIEDKKLTKGELTQAAVFEATYTKKENEYTITVIGGSGSGTYAYGAPVVATVTATPEAGKRFLFWSKDGAPVSYDATYKFSAIQDCTITAVFGDAVATDGINMVMQAPVVEGNMIAFTFERYVPENYDFISSGFVVGRSDCKRGETDVLMEAVSYRDGARTQFTKSLKKQNGVTTYYARGYVVYMDNGEVKTIYTESQKIVIE